MAPLFTGVDHAHGVVPVHERGHADAHVNVHGF
jgi:hypothetical protein